MQQSLVMQLNAQIQEDKAKLEVLEGELQKLQEAALQHKIKLLLEALKRRGKESDYFVIRGFNPPRRQISPQEGNEGKEDGDKGSSEAHSEGDDGKEGNQGDDDGKGGKECSKGDESPQKIQKKV